MSWGGGFRSAVSASETQIENTVGMKLPNQVLAAKNAMAEKEAMNAAGRRASVRRLLGKSQTV